MAGRKKIELGVGGHTDLRMTYVCAVRGMATSRLSHRSTVSRVRHYSAVADFFVTISACTGGGRRTTVREESSTAPLEMASVTRAQQAAGHQCHAWPTRTQRRRAAGVVACRWPPLSYDCAQLTRRATLAVRPLHHPRMHVALGHRLRLGGFLERVTDVGGAQVSVLEVRHAHILPGAHGACACRAKCV